MKRVLLAVVTTIFAAISSIAATAVEPDPSFTPEQVIQFQLDGLQQNDIEGMTQVWAFAHPDNKRFTGPLERFAIMMTTPNYRILLGHRDAEIRQLTLADNAAIYEVTVTGAEGAMVIYRWGLRRVSEGEHQGAWMTVTVSPPLGSGNEI